MPLLSSISKTHIYKLIVITTTTSNYTVKTPFTSLLQPICPHRLIYHKTFLITSANIPTLLLHIYEQSSPRKVCNAHLLHHHQGQGWTRFEIFDGAGSSNNSKHNNPRCVYSGSQRKLIQHSFQPTIYQTDLGAKQCKRVELWCGVVENSRRVG